MEIGVQETEVLHTQGVNVGAAVGEPGDIPKVVVDLQCDADQVVPDRTCGIGDVVTPNVFPANGGNELSGFARKRASFSDSF